MRYYICRTHPTVEGPFEVEYIAAQIRVGAITGETLVCLDGEEAWRPLHSVAELARHLAVGDLVSPLAAGAPDGAPGIPPVWSQPESRDHVLRDFGPLSVGGAIGGGWKVLSSNYGLLLGCVAVLVGLQLAANIAQAIFQGTIGGGGMGATTLSISGTGFSMVFGILVIFPLSIGLFLVGAEAARGRPNFNNLWQPFRRIFSLIVAYLLVLVLSAVVAIPLIVAAVLLIGGAGTSNSGSAAMIVGGILAILLFLIPVMWITARLSPTFLLLVDPEHRGLTIGGAIRHSWTITSGSAVRIILIGLLTGLIVAATFLACFLPGILLGYPLAAGIYGVAYCMLADRTNVAAATPMDR